MLLSGVGRNVWREFESVGGEEYSARPFETVGREEYSARPFETGGREEYSVRPKNGVITYYT